MRRKQRRLTQELLIKCFGFDLSPFSSIPIEKMALSSSFSMLMMSVKLTDRCFWVRCSVSKGTPGH